MSRVSRKCRCPQVHCMGCPCCRLAVFRRPRRLIAAVAVLAAGLAVAPAAASAANRRPARYPVTRLAWGTQSSDWHAWMRGPVPDASVTRVYYNVPDKFPSPPGRAALASGTYNAIPPAWPHFMNPHTHRDACVVLSIRTLVGPLLHHQLDARLRALKRTAIQRPDCDWLATWHEINAPGRPYPPSVRVPWNYRRMTRYLMRFFKGSPVRIGVILCGPTDKETKYLVRGEGWVGTDVYQFGAAWNQAQRLDRRLNQDLAATRAATGERWPVIIIPETNTKKDRARPTWFLWLAKWFARHDKRAAYRAVCTFWANLGTPGKHALSGPWQTAGKVTRHTLRTLAHDER